MRIVETRAAEMSTLAIKDVIVRYGADADQMTVIAEAMRAAADRDV